MIEKLKRIHYMFYASLVFMGFPFISILLGEVPYWHFFLALLFIASYLGILITENKKADLDLLAVPPSLCSRKYSFY